MASSESAPTPAMTPETISQSPAPVGEKRSLQHEIPDAKRLKLSTPDASTGDATEDVVVLGETVPQSSQTPAPDGEVKLTKRQLERLEKQKQREIERLEREKKKEEERRLKIEERERKEQEKRLKKELLEKEKERKREEERLKKEARRMKLEEEKKRKELDRKLKEEEKKFREEEKKRKEEEKKKKEELKNRSQMKISSFFALRPETSASPQTSPQKDKAKEVKQVSSYANDFLPFFQKKNVFMSATSQMTQEKLAESKSRFDKELQCPTEKLGREFLETPAKCTSHTFTSSQQLVEALNSAQATESLVHSLVENLPPIKYLSFYENSKPPYIGTWCSEQHLATRFTVTEPLDVSLTGFDYTYDSDLDWQDGDDDEGEDIDDLEEGEEEEDEANEDDDMEDFVENNEAAKRRGIIGTLQSVSRWNDGSAESRAIFDEIKYERLDFDIEFPIDPLKNYWKPVAQVSVSVAEKTPMSLTQLGTPVKGEAATNVLTPQKPTIKDEKVVEDLVKFIEKNSDFTIGTLSELAKKEFKSYTKSMLKHTIQEVAAYNKKKSVWEIKAKVAA